MAFLIGWPAVALALIGAAPGIIYRKPGLLVGSAVLIAPLSLYLGGTLRFPWCLGLSWIALLAAWVLSRGRRGLAIFLTVVVFRLYAWIFVVVQQAKKESKHSPRPWHEEAPAATVAQTRAKPERGAAG